MTNVEHHLLKAETTPGDGERWHKIEGTSVVTGRHGHEWTQYHLTCGQKLVKQEIEQESPEGDRPEDLNGNTICYGCTEGDR